MLSGSGIEVHHLFIFHSLSLPYYISTLVGVLIFVHSLLLPFLSFLFIFCLFCLSLPSCVFNLLWRE